MLYLLFLQYFATLSVTSPSSHKKLEESPLGISVANSYDSMVATRWHSRSQINWQVDQSVTKDELQ